MRVPDPLSVPFILFCMAQAAGGLAAIKTKVVSGTRMRPGASEGEREITYVDGGARSFRRLRRLSVLFVSASHCNTSNCITTQRVTRPAAQLSAKKLAYHAARIYP